MRIEEEKIDGEPAPKERHLEIAIEVLSKFYAEGKSCVAFVFLKQNGDKLDPGEGSFVWNGGVPVKIQKEILKRELLDDYDINSHIITTGRKAND